MLEKRPVNSRSRYNCYRWQKPKITKICLLIDKNIIDYRKAMLSLIPSKKDE